jgi:gliding motility-associated-like protein
MMKKSLSFLSCTFMLCFCINILNAQTPAYISVSDTKTDEQLVRDILINDPCAFVDNVQGVTGTSVGIDGIAFFTNTSPDFPISSGVVLSTDAATATEGPFTGTPGGGGWLEDSQLSTYTNNVLNVNDTYHDATSLEFEFTPVVDSVSFNFVFASHEYGSFQCAYSDPFAFFLENATTGQIVNLALVPGTTDPISVVTIRDDQWNPNCASENEEYFGVYYGNNQPGGQPATSAPINMEGHTVLMTATGDVIPFQKYRMKLVIQNRNDTTEDSAVFIEAGSFNIGSVDFLGPNIVPSSAVAVCEGQTLDLSVQELLSVIGGSTINISWTYNGAAIPGTDDQGTITVDQSGTYGVSIASPNFPTCSFDDTIEVDFKAFPEIPAGFGGNLILCDPNPQALLVATPENLSELNNINYTWYKDGIQIPNTGSTYTVTEGGTYTVEVGEFDCVATATINVETPVFSVDLGPDQEICGDSEAQLTAQVTDEGSTPPLDFGQLTYLWSTGATTESITVSESGTYTVDVTYGPCTETASVNIGISPLPEVSLGADFEICVDEGGEITADTDMDTGNLEYTWYRDGGAISGQSGSTLSITDPGTYRVEVNEAGSPACFGEDEIVVELYANENCIIPQGISPNGDQYNQTLDLAFLDDRVGISSIEIFNRYGRSVYEKTGGYTNEWFGQTDEGDELGTGTYFYVIKLEGTDAVFTEQVLTGWIYVNRQVN